jgi:ankyrin repeat protein
MLTASADIATCLLDNGADINSQCNEGFTALGTASARGCLAVVHVLLKRGAESHVLKHSQNAHTPFSAAINNDHEEITMLLLRHLVLQPDFNINHPRLGANQPLLCTAAVCAMPRVAELALRHGAAVDIVGPNGPPMRMAAENHQYAIVDLLCAAGADVNARYAAENGLDIAVRYLDIKMVRQMLKHGADVNAGDNLQHCTALQRAAMGGAPVNFERASEILKLLLAAGATFDPQGQRNMLCGLCSMLVDAAAAQILQLLLPHCSSAMMDDVDPTSGHTVLSGAVLAGKLQAARALHAAGASVQHSTKLHTMMQFAALSGSVAVVKWLQSQGVDARAAGSDCMLPLHSAYTVNQVEMVSYLLSLPGAADDVHAKTTQQQLTALHYAAGVESDGLLQLLLSRGAVVDAVDSLGATPLMYAKTASAMKVLLAAGADPAIVSTAGSNLLHYQASCGASTGAVCLAIKAGVDPTATDANECPPAHYAGIRGNFALEILLSRAADDHRKKRAAAETTSSTAAAASLASSSDGAETTTVTHSDAAASSDSSGAGASGQLTDIAAALSSMAVTAGSSNNSSNNSSSSSVEAADMQQQQQQQPKARKAKQPCANCTTPTTKLCRRCAAVHYCSVECQKACFADPRHRAQCEATAAEIV